MEYEFKKLIIQQGLELEDSKVEMITRYFNCLYLANQKTNLTGYKTAEEYVQYHLLDTYHICQLFDFTKVNSLMDVGTGCGVPGVIIKILYPHLKLALLETTKKKADFLQEWVNKYKIYDNNLIESNFHDIEVINDRAEIVAHDLTYREQYDVVIARALAPLTVAMELTVGFVQLNGVILLPRGSVASNINDDLNQSIEKNQQLEQIQNKNVHEQLSLSLESIKNYRLSGRDESFLLYQYTKRSKLNEKYPRKPGNIKKRPL